MQNKRGKTFLGECWGSCEPQQILGGEFFEKCQRKNLGGKFWGGSTKGACDAVGMVRNEKKGKIFKKKFRGDFLGGSYTGGRVWGECWEIKDKIGEKKISGGQKFWGGGNFWGKCKTKGGKLSWGSVGGAVNPNKF